MECTDGTMEGQPDTMVEIVIVMSSLGTNHTQFNIFALKFPESLMCMQLVQ